MERWGGRSLLGSIAVVGFLTFVHSVDLSPHAYGASWIFGTIVGTGLNRRLEGFCRGRILVGLVLAVTAYVGVHFSSPRSNFLHTARAPERLGKNYPEVFPDLGIDRYSDLWLQLATVVSVMPILMPCTSGVQTHQNVRNDSPRHGEPGQEAGGVVQRGQQSQDMTFRWKGAM